MTSFTRSLVPKRWLLHLGRDFVRLGHLLYNVYFYVIINDMTITMSFEMLPTTQQLCHKPHSFLALCFCFWIFGRTSVLFEGPLIPLFSTFGYACPGFQSQDGALICELPCLHAMDSSDSPLVRHLLTSWWLAWQPSPFFTHSRLTCSMDRHEWCQHPVYVDSVRSRTLMCDLLEMNSSSPPVVTSSCSRHRSHANIGNEKGNRMKGTLKDWHHLPLNVSPKERKSPVRTAVADLMAE